MVVSYARRAVKDGGFELVFLLGGVLCVLGSQPFAARMLRAAPNLLYKVFGSLAASLQVLVLVFPSHYYKRLLGFSADMVAFLPQPYWHIYQHLRVLL